MTTETPGSQMPPAGDEPAETVEPSRRTRRSALQLLGALAVGLVGGAAARSETAGATDDLALAVGQQNSATKKTSLLATGPIANDGAFVVEAAAADWALEGSSGQVGVLGSGYIGVTGTGDVGGFFSGTVAAISLQPQDAVGAPTSGDHAKGDLLVDATGVMYLCVADGSPGAWIKVSHGGYRPLATPVRAYDSRTVPAGKLRPGDGDLGSPRAIPIVGVAAGVPGSAVAVAGNLTVTQGEGVGFATIWPSGAHPGTSNINFSTQDVANSFTVGLGPGGQVNVAAWAPVHVIVDIAGYIL
jgi:hypothetical protein